MFVKCLVSELLTLHILYDIIIIIIIIMDWYLLLWRLNSLVVVVMVINFAGFAPSFCL
jgi:hypothetical protein